MPDLPVNRAEYLRDLHGGPAASALLWGMLFTGRVDSDVLAILGLSEVDADLVRQVYSEQLGRMQIELKLGDLPLNCLARLARSQAATFLAEAQTTRDPKLLRMACGALARLPEWSREPELYEQEIEARHAVASARIEEANLRREETRGRRLRLKLANDAVASAASAAALAEQARLLGEAVPSASGAAGESPESAAADMVSLARGNGQGAPSDEFQRADSGAFSTSKVKTGSPEAPAEHESRLPAPELARKRAAAS